MLNAESDMLEALAESARQPQDAVHPDFGRELEAARAAFADRRVSLPLPDSCELELLMKRLDDGCIAVGIEASDLMELVWDAEPTLLAAAAFRPEDGAAPDAAAVLDVFAEKLENSPVPGLPDGMRAFCAQAVRGAAAAAAACREEEDAGPHP